MCHYSSASAFRYLDLASVCDLGATMGGDFLCPVKAACLDLVTMPATGLFSALYAASPLPVDGPCNLIVCALTLAVETLESGGAVPALINSGFTVFVSVPMHHCCAPALIKRRLQVFKEPPLSLRCWVLLNEISFPSSIKIILIKITLSLFIIYFS